ncbi:hypothetical protein H6P81_000358 [Aristolochia fimbriata]|uniref:Uncharacterized protein n=1 Tax=Aristolochia fimbriata TaxID=158543 RepID=A0AAV7F3V7_ARIFI|nr:hypothetical protein H6P81_000358 [Aristolochia fimbriata]
MSARIGKRRQHRTVRERFWPKRGRRPSFYELQLANAMTPSVVHTRKEGTGGGPEEGALWAGPRAGEREARKWGAGGFGKWKAQGARKGGKRGGKSESGRKKKKKQGRRAFLSLLGSEEGLETRRRRAQNVRTDPDTECLWREKSGSGKKPVEKHYKSFSL